MTLDAFEPISLGGTLSLTLEMVGLSVKLIRLIPHPIAFSQTKQDHEAI